MLVVTNGPPKSGSTWLYSIAKEILPGSVPPSRYRNPRWLEPTVIPGRVADYLHYGEHRNQDVLIKSHYGLLPLRWLLLNDPQVRVLDIWRDLRDVVVSAYYQTVEPQVTREPFASYYWQYGRGLAKYVLDYHIVWTTDSPRYLCVGYEALLSDFAAEIAPIGNLLGMALDAEQIKEIRRATQIDHLRAHSGLEQDRFRRGVAGEWADHFDPAMLRDLASIQQRGQNKLYRQLVKARSTYRYLRTRVMTVSSR